LSTQIPARRRGRNLFLGAGLLVALATGLLVVLSGAAQAKPHKPKPQSEKVTVMTRNLYLGADLGPAIGAVGFNDFISKNGQILRDVDTNNYPVRSRGLAKEILGKKPDLVGLQEVAMWRTGPVNLTAAAAGGCRKAQAAGTPCTATTVKYDFLAQLMDRLNKGQKRYRIVKVQKQFDFEAPGDYNNVPGDGGGPAGINDNGEINGRLTMRDAILARVGAGVRTSNARSGNFETVYAPLISGIEVPVDRGWVSVNAKVRDSRKFRFIDTHFEAFGDPTIRESQAKELFTGAKAPANSRLPVILVGDLNSDDNTVSGGDRLAYNALKGAGFRDRSTETPMSCCVKSGILTDNFGAKSDFDHHIDHILTRDPAKVKLVKSWVTGRTPANGYWDSDHAGVTSKLRIFR
jgi:endonuclease/exonuclease/phosphatase family metal-dependent hydrolase